ncbi:MAG: Nramp family divalent metal transporter [Pirellulales bacterium]
MSDSTHEAAAPRHNAPNESTDPSPAADTTTHGKVTDGRSTFVPPHPGSQQMPQWNADELVEPPRFTWRNWFAMLGPGLIMGGAAIGGGEWLVGPEVTAKYGGSLLWLATLSILGQVVYNLEISRYTLYTGEPIFTGKFRTLPGPAFWLCVYLVLDFGAVFPYLAANAATPLAMLILGGVPDPENIASHWWLHKGLSYLIFFGSMLPLVFGGKIYNALKILMSFKIFTVLGFLLVLGIFYSSPVSWGEIARGFFQFGTVPVRHGEDVNGNGVLDPGEDWDSDGNLDVLEEEIDSDGDGVFDSFNDVDGDGIRDGDNVENVFLAWLQGRDIPIPDLTLIASLSALVAIAGSGGLSNTPISNYTRDSGWGMGHHVGAIPSIVGGHDIKLSHVGSVFEVTKESLVRWHKWYRHVLRDQLIVWMPACFLGLGAAKHPLGRIPPPRHRGLEVDGRGHDGRRCLRPRRRNVSRRFFWFMTLFCGFLVLGPSMASTADGLVRAGST